MRDTEQRAMTRGETIAVIEQMDPHYAKILRDFHAEMDALIALPPRLARLCNLGAATAVRAPGLVREFLESGRDAGATPEELLEVLFLSMNFAGIAALSEALLVFRSVFGEKAVKGQRVQDYPPAGRDGAYDRAALEVGAEMYGTARAKGTVDMFRAVGGPRFAEALEAYAYAGLCRRKVLSSLERELISVALLSCIERPNPFLWHAKAALRLGASAQQLRHAVLGQSTVSGVLTAFRGITALNPLIDDWRAHPGAEATL